jgi:hypothetical protein
VGDHILREFIAESNENLNSQDREIERLKKHPANRETLASLILTIQTIMVACGSLWP